MARPRLVERRVDRFMREPASVRGAVGVIVVGTAAVIVGSAFLMRLLDRKEYHTTGRGLWWAVQTVTTVGYGDVTPAHASGRIVAAAVMLWGIAFLAILTAAITSTFVARAERERERTERELERETAAQLAQAEQARHEELLARLDRIDRLLPRDGQGPT